MEGEIDSVTWKCRGETFNELASEAFPITAVDRRATWRLYVHDGNTREPKR